MSVRFVDEIVGTTRITRNIHYHYTHRKANEAEKEYEGLRIYHMVNRAVMKLPKNHLAAKIDMYGNVTISREFLELIPKKYHLRVIKGLTVHEKTELRLIKPYLRI